MGSFQIWMNVGLFVITAVVFVVMVTKTKMKENPEYARKRLLRTIRRYGFWYENFLFRGPFRRTAELYGSLQCYSIEEAQAETVKSFERALLIAIAMPVLTMILMRDTFVTLIMCVFALVYFNTTLNKKYDKIYVQLMEECSLTIASIRERFMETESIPLAVLYAEHSDMIDAPIKFMYKMLTSVHGEQLMEEFMSAYPIPIIRTLANVCYILNDEGVERRSDGSDSFTDSLTVLRQECDAEIRRLTKQRIAFNSLATLSLIGLAVEPAIELYLLNMIPGTASMLKGYYGFILHIAVILVTAGAYYYVTTACRPSVAASSDRMEFIDKLVEDQKIRTFVRPLFPKEEKQIQKWKERIDGALSSKDYYYIYTSKVVFSSVLFVLTLIGLIFGTITVRSNFYNNYDSLSFIPTSVKEPQQVQINIMDDELMAMPEEQFQTFVDDKEEFKAYIQGRVTGLSDSEADTQAERLYTKYSGYHNAVFHWWWPLVMFAVGAIGWFIPEISLSIRKKLVAYESSVDVSQLQTLMIVLSETKMDGYKVICWLQKQATIHDGVLRLARCRYIAEPEKCLEELENATPEHDFKRMIRQLKSAVYSLSLKEAFSGLKLDKQQSLAINEMLRSEEIEQRKNSAKLIAIAPAAVALVGALLGPVLILGITQMTDTLSQLGGM